MKKIFYYLVGGRQTTLRKSFTISGRSMIKNKLVEVRCRPTVANRGLVFKFDGISIPVKAKNYYQTDYHTTSLSNGCKSILTVEHVLSAFYGMGVDNAVIEVIGDSQLPLLDGSSRLWSEAIQAAGIKYLKDKNKVIVANRSLAVKSSTDDSVFLFLPSARSAIRVIIDFDSVIGCQTAEFIFGGRRSYPKNIAPARTFFIEPFNQRRWRQLRRLITCLPIDPRYSAIVAYDQNGFLSPPRFINEQARHKLLDIIGDLSFLGSRFRGEIIVYKPSHRFTAKVIREIVSCL